LVPAVGIGIEPDSKEMRFLTLLAHWRTVASDYGD